MEEVLTPQKTTFTYLDLDLSVKNFIVLLCGRSKTCLKLGEKISGLGLNEMCSFCKKERSSARRGYILSYFLFIDEDRRVQTFDLMKCVAAAKRKGVVQEDNIYFLKEEIMISTLDEDLHMSISQQLEQLQ
ncbi:hypothetical protein QL285_062445 [Trifolium repens]|nr:hypothetical protein QL285_062445 [Trifolium repens]